MEICVFAKWIRLGFTKSCLSSRTADDIKLFIFVLFFWRTVLRFLTGYGCCSCTEPVCHKYDVVREPTCTAWLILRLNIGFNAFTPSCRSGIMFCPAIVVFLAISAFDVDRHALSNLWPANARPASRSMDESWAAIYSGRAEHEAVCQLVDANTTSVPGARLLRVLHHINLSPAVEGEDVFGRFRRIYFRSHTG